jgi:hypothetical protein
MVVWSTSFYWYFCQRPLVLIEPDTVKNVFIRNFKNSNGKILPWNLGYTTGPVGTKEGEKNYQAHLEHHLVLISSDVNIIDKNPSKNQKKSSKRFIKSKGAQNFIFLI